MTAAHPPVQALNELLARLSSADNNVRTQAEAELHQHWVTAQPQDFLLGLVFWVRQHQDPNVRSFAAILLRRMGLRPPVMIESGQEDATEHPILWEKLSNEARGKVQEELLASLRDELDPSVRKKVSDTISELAAMLREDDEMHQRSQFSWQPLMDVLMQCSQLPKLEYRESVFWILSYVPVLLWPLQGSTAQTMHALTQWKPVFLAGLQDPQSVSIRLAALKALVSLLLTEEWEAKQRTSWAHDLMIPMANVLPPLMDPNSRDEVALSEALSSMIELAETLPRLLKDLLGTLIPFLVAIVKDADLDATPRQTALELLVTIAETAPGMCRKLEKPGFCEQVVPAALMMMTEIEDDEEWYTTTNIEGTDDSDCNYIVGEQAMDRLARSLGGKHLLPPTFAILPSFFGSSEWNQRYAALMCVSAVGEGCVKLMEKELGRVVDMVLPHLVQDPHPRVRYAACNAIGQMCTDFSPMLQEQFHEKIVLGLCSTMDCVDQPRVQAHGAAALVNFCEEATQEVIIPYLETIFAKLTVLLQTPLTYLQEQAITTLATVADAAGDKFVNYYSGVIGVLLNILQSANAKEYRLLRGKAMECASLIALAVGKEHFAPHAKQLIDYMLHTQQTATDPDDPQVSYLLASWARLCKVLGADFVPYLDVVMPPLLASARHRPDVTVLDPDENEEEKGFSAEEGWEFVKIDQQKIGIKTSALEEKCTAVEMLICYARELGAGFQKYSEEVLRLVVPLLTFYFHEGVRHAAAAVIPHLFNSMKAAQFPPEQLMPLWRQTISSLLIVIHDEPDAESLVQFLIAFYESLQVMGPGSLSNATVLPLPSPAAAAADPLDSGSSGIHPIISENVPLLAYFGRAVTGQISEVFHRIQTRTDRRLDQDLYDHEMEETLRDEEDMEDAVLGELSRAVHIVFKMHGQEFLPFFHQNLLPAVSGMIHSQPAASPSQPAAIASSLIAANQAKQWAVCVIDDLIEFCGAGSAWEYRAHFWDAFLQGIMNVRLNGDGGSSDVRQACCYGLGVLAQSIIRYPGQSAEVQQMLLERWASPLLESLSMLLTSLSPEYKLKQTGKKQQPANDDDDEYAGQRLADENAVSAIGKIMHYIITPLLLQNSSMVSQQQFEQVLGQWFQYLPIVEDEEEAVHSYGYMLHLLFSGSNNAAHPINNDPSQIQESNLNPLFNGQVERVLYILLKAITSGVLSSSKDQKSEFGSSWEISERVKLAARFFGSRCTADQKQRIWSQLPENEQRILAAMGGWV